MHLYIISNSIKLENGVISSPKTDKTLKLLKTEFLFGSVGILILLKIHATGLFPVLFGHIKPFKGQCFANGVCKINIMTP